MKLHRYRPYEYRRPMSKKVALLITRELWQWLADNPETTFKGIWPKWSKVNRIYGGMESSCPCCEFAIRENVMRKGSRCDFCPLLGYAWCHPYSYPCQSHGSPYKNWWEAVKNFEYTACPDTPEKMEIRRTSALQIVEGCNKALKALELEKLMVNVSII